MKYYDGTDVKLGDIVKVPIGPNSTALARVVMLGETYEHLDINENFVAWVKQDRVLEESHLVIEWTEANPFAHDDPQYSPVGNQMFTPLDECVEFVRRADSD